MFDWSLNTFLIFIASIIVVEICTRGLHNIFRIIERWQEMATSKTWTRTLDPDPGPGPWTRTLKNLDPEKPGSWRTWTLKNMGNSWIWKNA